MIDCPKLWNCIIVNTLYKTRRNICSIAIETQHYSPDTVSKEMYVSQSGAGFTKIIAVLEGVWRLFKTCWINWKVNSCQALCCCVVPAAHTNRMRDGVWRCRHGPPAVSVCTGWTEDFMVLHCNYYKDITSMKYLKILSYLKYPMIKMATSRALKDTAYPIVYMTYSRSKKSCCEHIQRNMC